MSFVTRPMLRGPLFQVVWVVEDIQVSERWFTDTFGVPAWSRWNEVHFAPENASFRGRPADFVIDVSIGYAGRQQIELVTPVRGESPFAERLRDIGPGLHHVAFEVQDLQASVLEAVGRGMEVLLRGSFEAGVEFVYLQSPEGDAGIIELTLLEPAMARYFERLAETSSTMVTHQLP